jgi:hypothetical protein
MKINLDWKRLNFSDPPPPTKEGVNSPPSPGSGPKSVPASDARSPQTGNPTSSKPSLPAQVEPRTSPGELLVYDAPPATLVATDDPGEQWVPEPFLFTPLSEVDVDSLGVPKLETQAEKTVASVPSHPGSSDRTPNVSTPRDPVEPEHSLRDLEKALPVEEPDLSLEDMTLPLGVTPVSLLQDYLPDSLARQGIELLDLEFQGPDLLISLESLAPAPERRLVDGLSRTLQQYPLDGIRQIQIFGYLPDADLPHWRYGLRPDRLMERSEEF